MQQKIDDSQSHVLPSHSEWSFGVAGAVGPLRVGGTGAGDAAEKRGMRNVAAQPGRQSEGGGGRAGGGGVPVAGAVRAMCAGIHRLHRHHQTSGPTTGRRLGRRGVDGVQQRHNVVHRASVSSPSGSEGGGLGRGLHRPGPVPSRYDIRRRSRRKAFGVVVFSEPQTTDDVSGPPRRADSASAVCSFSDV